MDKKELDEKLRLNREEAGRLEVERQRIQTEERRLAREAETKKRTEFKKELLEKYDLTDHPKADQLYNLAWEFGHSSGYENVRYFFGEMADLLKD